MRNQILAGAAALALAIPAVASAQDVAVAADGTVYVLTEPQQVMYDAWPPESRVMYDAWPNDVKGYYWTLTPDQQDGWWVLDDEQRMRVYTMTPAQRAAAWTQISAQLNGAAPSAMARTTTAAMPAGTANMRFVSNAMVQPISADQAVVAGGDIPICTANQQDNCINSWEARKTGTRPLNYWPGRPASEIDGPLPAEDPND